MISIPTDSVDLDLLIEGFRPIGFAYSQMISSEGSTPVNVNARSMFAVVDLPEYQSFLGKFPVNLYLLPIHLPDMEALVPDRLFRFGKEESK